MKIMKIKIQNRKGYEVNLKKIAKEIDKKNPPKPLIKNGIYFESLTAVRKILTDNRLDVWRAIRDKKPESITQLAEILGRGFRPVHRDVKLLKELGLIKLIEGPGGEGMCRRWLVCLMSWCWRWGELGDYSQNSLSYKNFGLI